jgi:hypothetical protein
LNKKLEGGLGTWNPAKSVEQDRLAATRERIADAELPDWYARVQTMRNPVQRDGLLLALVNATYIAQAVPHLAQCQAAIEAALWKRMKPNPRRAGGQQARLSRRRRGPHL